MSSTLRLRLFGLLGLALVAAGCAQNGTAGSDDPPVPQAAGQQRPDAPRKADAAPEKYRVKFETSTGDFVVEVTRAWAPHGADRIHQLVKAGFYDDCRFFRVVPDFMVQFGINGDPKVQAKWRDANIQDDPVAQSNQRGFVTFAKTNLPNSRSTQIFINYGDNSFLDDQGFAPFGRVVEGMEVVDKINSEYRERPDQGRLQTQGNAYLNQVFPRLDHVKKATVVEGDQDE